MGRAARTRPPPHRTVEIRFRPGTGPGGRPGQPSPLRDLIKEAVEDTGRHVVHQLERFLNTLGTIAGISPLLGLLGTVIGMIKVFSAIMAHGVGNANQLAGGISEALITTAAGLTVAIPSFFFYRYFKGTVEAYVVSMEEQAINLIEAIDRGNVAQLRSGVPGG